VPYVLYLGLGGIPVIGSWYESFLKRAGCKGTANRKTKVVSKKEWILNTVTQSLKIT